MFLTKTVVTYIINYKSCSRNSIWPICIFENNIYKEKSEGREEKKSHAHNHSTQQSPDAFLAFVHLCVWLSI